MPLPPDFDTRYAGGDRDDDGVLLLFRGQEVYMGEEPDPFPQLSEVEIPEEPLGIGRHRGRKYFALLLEDSKEEDVAPGERRRWVNRRSSFHRLSSYHFWISARGYQLARWERESRFCGLCGSPQERCETELGKVCPRCGHREYPRIAPAMIVAVVSRGRLLMAHATKHREGLYSVLAGFVEPGESLEECVAREVREESGIELAEITYFASQSWPFPNSLMVAFTATAATEEITVDEEEIGEAGWFTPRETLELPEIPGAVSVSRRLIDWFIDRYGDEETRALHHRRP
ncbi:MAG: NAD(+) diphosphatase [Alkalispirochaetaceae bacterium]